MTTQGIIGQPPAPVTPKVSRKPSTLGYWIAVALVVAGFIGGGVLAVATGIGAYDRLTDLPRATVPGDMTVEITETGDQLVYYLGDADTTWRDLGLEVSGPDGRPVTVTSYLPSLHIASVVTHDDELHWGAEDWDDHQVVVATFDADTTGAYTVTTAGSAEDGAELAVGENLVRPVVILMLVAGGVALAGLAGGVTLFVVTGARRSRARVA
jgi:hypothetical protein